MSCTICTKTKPIPQCSESVILGTVAETEVILVFTDVVTNRQRSIEGTVDAGTLSFDMDALGGFISPNFLYTIQGYDTSLDNLGDPITITKEGEEYTCLNLSVSPIVNEEGEIEGATEITLTVEG